MSGAKDNKSETNILVRDFIQNLTTGKKANLVSKTSWHE